MYIDKKNMFSDKQSVTVTASSASVVDLAAGDAGLSANLFVGADGFSGTGSLVVELLTADSADAPATLNAPVTIATFPVSNTAIKAGGLIVAAGLPRGMKRYAGLKYTVTGTLTGGLISSGIVMDL